MSINHAVGKLYSENGGKLSKKNKGKEWRLVLLHTIGEDDHLVEVDNSTGRPIDELK